MAWDNPTKASAGLWIHLIITLIPTLSVVQLVKQRRHRISEREIVETSKVHWICAQHAHRLLKAMKSLQGIEGDGDI